MFQKVQYYYRILEVKTFNSKIFVTANGVFKILIPDYQSLTENTTIEEIIQSVLEDDLSIVKIVFRAV